MIGRFCPKEARIDAKRQFRSRTLRLGEDLDAFVYNLELLHSRAWPQQGEDARNEQLMDQFIEGLSSQLRQKVIENDPGTYAQAKELVRRLIRADFDSQSCVAEIATIFHLPKKYRKCQNYENN